MELEKAKAIAEELKGLLKPACEIIEIAGSIRRQKPFVGDVELLCIPKFIDGVDQLDREIGALFIQGILGFRLNKIGSRVYGPKNKLLIHKPTGMAVDIFSTDKDCWVMSLIIRTGPKDLNIKLAKAAHRKGLHMLAYGPGFRVGDGPTVLTADSERGMFEYVDWAYLEPWERG